MAADGTFITAYASHGQFFVFRDTCYVIRDTKKLDQNQKKLYNIDEYEYQSCHSSSWAR